MRTDWSKLAVAAIVAMSAPAAIAGEYDVVPAAAAVSGPSAGAEFAAWGMDVIPSNYINNGDSDTCDPSGSNCDAALGWGGSASVYLPLNQNLSLSADLMYEFHFETDKESRDDHANYGAVGFHLTQESNPDMPWGGFVFLASGSNNEDGDQAGPVAGAGAEIMVSGFTVQAGGMFLLNPEDDADDTLENMFFAGVSKGFSLGAGELTAGAMVGFGDFDESPTADDQGSWYQVSLIYDAPLGDTGMNWFAGYQGDLVSVDDGSVEEAIFHTAKVGIRIPIGGGAGPFSTPNFRAPLVNAGQFN